MPPRFMGTPRLSTPKSGVHDPQLPGLTPMVGVVLLGRVNSRQQKAQLE